MFKVIVFVLEYICIVIAPSLVVSCSKILYVVIYQFVSLCETEYNISRCNVNDFQFIRKINEDTMASFSNELSQQTWKVS